LSHSARFIDVRLDIHALLFHGRWTGARWQYKRDVVERPGRDETLPVIVLSLDPPQSRNFLNHSLESAGFRHFVRRGSHAAGLVARQYIRCLAHRWL
jgi:hypothetical protein